MAPPSPSADPAAPLLRDRDFLGYTAARGLSLIGTITTLIALPVLVYRLSGSASFTALVTALEAAPYLLLGLLAGAHHRPLAVPSGAERADLLGARLLASVPAAHWLDVLTVPHILAVAFLGPALAVFFDGAAFGALPTLVGRKRVAQANSYVWTVQSLAEVVVPSLAGLALAVLHPATLLSIDALSFAASALLLAGIARPLQDDSRARPPFSLRGIAADIGEGLGYLWRHAGIRTMTIVGFTQCVAGGGFVSLMVVWSDRQLGIGTEGLRFGLVYGSWAVGSIVASLSLPRLLRGTTPARVTLLALPFSAVLGVVTPAWTDWRLGALSLMVWSVFYTTVVINSISYRQEVTPFELRRYLPNI